MRYSIIHLRRISCHFTGHSGSFNEMEGPEFLLVLFPTL